MAKIMNEEGGAGAGPRPATNSTGRRMVPTASSAAEMPRPASPPAEQASEAASGTALTPAAPKPAPRRRRRMVLVAALVGVLGAGGYYGYDWWTNGRFMVSTDDAYVAAERGDVTPRSPAMSRTSWCREQPGQGRRSAGHARRRRSPHRACPGRGQIATATGIDRADRRADHRRRGRDRPGRGTARRGRGCRPTTPRPTRPYQRPRGQGSRDDQGARCRADSDPGPIGRDLRQGRGFGGRRQCGVSRAQQAEAGRVLEQYRLARDQAQLDLDHTVIRATVRRRRRQSALPSRASYVQPGPAARRRGAARRHLCRCQLQGDAARRA